MAFEILEIKEVTENVFFVEVFAGRISQVRKPGQFVILRPRADSERIPLTIVDSNSEKQSLSLIVQAVGKTTKDLCSMKKGESIKDLAGPLGKPTPIKKYGTVVCVGGGIGVAPILPIAKGFKEQDNEVISIIGARTKDLIILEKEMEEVSDKLLIVTDDGSYKEKGFVTNALKNYIDTVKMPDLVIAIGPLPMMRAVANLTKTYNISTMVSLNSIMIDGTGMCGGCRVTVGNEIKYTCVDGPEFDAHKVDFDELQTRLGMYKEFEKHSEENCRLNKYIKTEKDGNNETKN